jgi:hypothetical protein
MSIAGTQGDGHKQGCVGVQGHQGDAPNCGGAQGPGCNEPFRPLTAELKGLPCGPDGKIAWKIGEFYKTRSGMKRRLFGIQENGHLWFESPNGFFTFKLNREGEDFESEKEDIICEWEEPKVPYKHECEIWIQEVGEKVSPEFVPNS